MHLMDLAYSTLAKMNIYDSVVEGWILGHIVNSSLLLLSYGEDKRKHSNYQLPNCTN